MPKQSITRQKSFQNTAELVLGWPSNAGHGALSGVCTSSLTPLEQINLSFANDYHLLILGKGWELVSTHSV